MTPRQEQTITKLDEQLTLASECHVIKTTDLWRYLAKSLPQIQSKPVLIVDSSTC